ncbi:MAG: type II secretion system protein [Clostridia bacterium]|nr:type II secretion system protein [Clostridia bacterium]
MLKNGENKGITLISLIVTIVVLLILAGVTISQITGSESAMEKATEAREKDKQGTELETIKLAVVNSVASGLDGLVNAENLKEGLNGIVEDEGRLKIKNENAPWIVTGKTGMKYKINQNGEVTFAEPVASVEFVNTADSIAVGKSKKLEIVAKGASGNVTEANEITFSISNTSIATIQEDGNIKIADNATVGITITVTVVADGIEGSNTCTITISAELKIGDYVTIDSTQYNAVNTTKLATLNEVVGSSTDRTALTRNANMQWRVLEKDNNGNPTKLISASTAGNLQLRGPNGYNNAVYLLDGLSDALYSTKLGITRNLKIDDVEKHFNDNAKAAKEAYSGDSIVVAMNETKNYTGKQAYPSISANEIGIGIDGLTSVKTKNDLGAIEKSEQNEPYSGYDFTSANGLTVTETYYYLGSPRTIYEMEGTDNIYYTLFNGIDKSWLSSRSIRVMENICDFCIVRLSSNSVGNVAMTTGNGYYNPSSLETNGIRPVIIVNSNITTTYSGKYGNTNYNIFSIK